MNAGELGLLLTLQAGWISCGIIAIKQLYITGNSFARMNQIRAIQALNKKEIENGMRVQVSLSFNDQSSGS